MKAMIFGIGGQDGFYLSNLLERSGIDVIGIDRSAGQPRLSDYGEILGIIKTHQPAYIFHLAAHSSTAHDCWQENHDTICTGTLNILESIKTSSPASKLFLAGSGLQFLNNNKPIKETDPFDATSMYAVSRIQSVYAARYYRSLGLQVYVGYLFNHDSPRRSEKHINKKILETAKRIAGGSGEKLRIGDPHAEKEFGFAGDIVEGIWTFMNQNKIFEATIGTGISHTVEEWMQICFGFFGLNWEDHVVDNPDFVSGYKKLVSDPSTIFSLGWKPATTIHKLAAMMKE